MCNGRCCPELDVVSPYRICQDKVHLHHSLFFFFLSCQPASLYFPFSYFLFVSYLCDIGQVHCLRTTLEKSESIT